MKTGFIKLHRSILSDLVATNNDYFGLFVRLLLMANHTENTFLHGNEKITLKKGQLLTGRKSLASDTGLSESKLQRLLKTLEKCNVIEQQTNNRYRVITIVNYDSYFESEQQTNNKRTTNEQQTNTNKNDNNDKNEKKYNIKGSSKRTSPYSKKKYEQFIDWFNKFTGSKFGYTDKKAQRQLKYLLENGVTSKDIQRSVSGALSDDYLLGVNESGKKYLTPEFITRTDKYEKYREVYRQDHKE